MTGTDHPFVTEYLAGFDAASGSISQPRRSVLREEIGAHLRDAVPLDSSDAEAMAVIAAFGSPAEIIGQELDGSAATAPSSRPHRMRTILIAIGVLIVAVLLATWMWWPGARPQPVPSTAPTPSPAVTSVVNETPEGPPRVTTGEAYAEYRAAIDQMEHPLPAGAAYPLGVPEGLDAGAQGDGMLESGAGRNLAYFSWLCAWEAEYLSAVDAADDRRKVEAASMITAWSTSDFYLAMGDADHGWVTNVVGPMKFGDASGVEQDLPNTCAQAAIVNVTR